ncbi:MAG: hydroxymethylglutaryl-CoA lyase [Acidobacteria bacterium]|nr:hydroxymethylglutaryl-CoA lyase [Acidobacteriota bacterium]
MAQVSTLTLPAKVTIVEVGPRDGLQNEAAEVATADKIAFVDRLGAAGLPVVEVTAFVSPRWVPRMADAEAVLAGITRRPGTRYAALVPNLRGLERALSAGVDELAIFAAASETFSRRNINQDIDTALATYREVCREALGAGVRVRGYLSTSFGCPFEGAVPVERVADVAARLVDLGVFEVSVSDTIGVANPGQVGPVVAAVARHTPLAAVALHFHDTRGMALANVLAGLLAGVTTFDASAGGLGGCPFAPGAAGNLATEDLVHMLDGLGIETGVSLAGVVEASRLTARAVGHPLPSRVYQALSRST